ncbi:MAG: type II toxin-antitoxin system HicB family antitoxin [Acidobacteriota bacterium]|mgnify:CR=1 FL=1
MDEIRYTAIYEEAEEGGYIGYVAELPGANTQGVTLEETRENLKNAVELLLECYRDEADKKLTNKTIKESLILEAA